MHVCRRWRSLVFISPRRLNLRLCCTARTPVRDMLDVWPPFPLIIFDTTNLTDDLDNILAALERRDRVDQIFLFQDAHSTPFEKVFAAMQEPFPELTVLHLDSRNKLAAIVPDSFLGESAPRLRHLVLCGISFPGLPKLLLSATHIVYLQLLKIPHSGHISPAAMVTALSTLTSLQFLGLQFQSRPSRSHPDLESRRSPPLIRSVLPILREIWFKGVCEYLEDFVARINAPKLIYLAIAFFDEIVFDTTQLTQFITRTPGLKPVENAHLIFGNRGCMVNSSSQRFRYEVRISCRELDWQVSSLEQLCALHLSSPSVLEDLYIYEHLTMGQPDWQDNTENTLWLELLHRFTTVKNLYISKEFAPHIVAALQELVGGRTTEVLPTLQNIFLEEVEPGGRVQEDIGRIVSARQLSGHTITVSHWERDPRQERDLTTYYEIVD